MGSYYLTTVSVRTVALTVAPAFPWYTLINANQSRGVMPLRKPSATMVSRMPITKARINLGQLAKRAHLNNEYFILEKDGIPIIGIMDADEMEDYLELQDPTVKDFIAKSHKEYLAGRGRPAEELLVRLRQQVLGKTKKRKRVKA
jgi:hypothetical protein